MGRACIHPLQRYFLTFGGFECHIEIDDMENDYELIKLFQDGDKASFDRLVRRHLSNTVGFFYTITRDKMASEDLAQDVFFKLY